MNIIEITQESMTYHFHNITIDEKSSQPVFGFTDSEVYNGLCELLDAEIIGIFRHVITNNSWDTHDVIRAEPDDSKYPTIVYSNGSVKFINLRKNEPDSEDISDYEYGPDTDSESTYEEEYIIEEESDSYDADDDQ